MFSGIFISIGPIIDESIDHSYVNSRSCAKARQLLLLMWLLVGFILTLSYKSVLLSTLVNIGYEKPIDNVDDLLKSGKSIMIPGNTMVPDYMKNDPRKRLNEVAKKQMILYNFTGKIDKRIIEGQVSSFDLVSIRNKRATAL